MMNRSEFGSVKFQNAYEYYDIMYNLSRQVLKKSIVCSAESYGSIKSYYNALKELYEWTEAFLTEHTMELKYKKALYNVINEMKKTKERKEVVELLGISNKQLTDIEEMKIMDAENVMLIDYLDQIELMIDQANVYARNNAHQELIKRTKRIKQLMSITKRLLFNQMKANRLTVPMRDFDPNKAITHGFE